MKSLQNKYIIVTIKSWNIEAARKLTHRYPGAKIMLVTHKKDLVYSRISKFNPKYIFFPHWSWIIPKKIYTNFECVVFHMTDLPFGRGGSPLQNLIVRGITKTKIAALKVIKRLDAGPIYIKKNLSLHDSAGDIYKRISRIIFGNMIPYIIKNKPIPVPQKGSPVVFKRRKPEQSKIPHNIDLEGIYDYIRMLDAEGYPPAFHEIQNLRFEFRGALKKGNRYVDAKIHIRRKR